MIDCFLGKFASFELEPDEESPDSELESEFEEDAALRADLFVVGVSLSSSVSESELELELVLVLVPELEVAFALRFDVLGRSSSSSELESELELEVESEDDVAGSFARRAFLLFFPSLELGTEVESISTSDSSLDSSVDSSAVESVWLESRRDSFEIATTGTVFLRISLSSLLSVPT